MVHPTIWIGEEMVGGASLLPSSCVHLWSEGKAKAERRNGGGVLL